MPPGFGGEFCTPEVMPTVNESFETFSLQRSTFNATLNSIHELLG